MSEEEKKPEENLEPQAEEKKDASGQWKHCSRTNYCGVNNNVVYDGPDCNMRSFQVCGMTQAI